MKQDGKSSLLSCGGVQALGLPPKGVTENDSPVINAVKKVQAGKAPR